MTIANYFANPYDTDATGFYFASFEEYAEKSAALLNRSGAPVEEFMIDYIDGDDAQLFEACKVDQANLEFWFDEVEMLTEDAKASLFYLVSVNGQDVREALGNLYDVCLSVGSLVDVASELFDEIYLSKVPESVQAYIDYDKFANDCRLSGDMYEFTFNGETYTCTSANS
jgi:hypothetical protein